MSATQWKSLRKDWPKICTFISIRTIWAPCYTQRKEVHSAAQLSLLVSDAVVISRCVNSKYTYAHQYAHGCVGLKMRPGTFLVHCYLEAKWLCHWPTKTWSKVNGAVFSCFLKVALFRCAYIGRFTTSNTSRSVSSAENHSLLQLAESI